MGGGIEVPSTTGVRLVGCQVAGEVKVDVIVGEAKVGSRVVDVRVIFLKPQELGGSEARGLRGMRLHLLTQYMWGTMQAY